MKGRSGPIYLFCGFTLAGTSVITARYVSGKLGIFTITAVSLFFALMFLLPLCWKQLRKAIRKLSGMDILLLVIQALFGMFLFRMFLIKGLQYTSAGEAGILTGATPAITALLAMIILKERISGKKFIGIISTVGGIFLIQGLLSQGNSFSREHFLGNILVICAVACEALFNIISRSFAIKTGEKSLLNPIVQTALVSAIALLLCIIPALFENAVPLIAGLGVLEWFALFWYGMFVTAIGFIFWYAGINRCGAFTAAAFSGMMPFTSMILSVVLLGEMPGWQQWSGGILIIGGMVLISYNSRYHEP